MQTGRGLPREYMPSIESILSTNTKWDITNRYAGIYGLRPLKFNRCAELDGAARLRLTLAISSSRTAKPAFHRMKRCLGASHPAKPTFHRMK